MLNDILYVEDNLDHAELVLRQLERRGLRERVVHVEDGERAVAYLDRVASGDSLPPRLVLLDLRLPRVDGMDVLSHVKGSAVLRDIPVVIFTTSTTPHDLKEAYSRYANSYLVKPDDLTELNHVLDELSHYWLEMNRRSAG
ncbi:MAG TPA: response regulator [Polyangiaceae bacterium]|nr:response regulator [Polyangiaceae bacterium]